MFPPNSLAEMLADLAGYIVGTALSPRGLVMLVITAAIGVFRASVAWAIIVGLASGFLLVGLRWNSWLAAGHDKSGQEYLIVISISSSVLIAALGWLIGRLVRRAKDRQQPLL